ncbi:hypothetical protein [uncultured Pontibacter sp.]|nr:hypothetical protein [uncultured Pontibacter sp.]
MNRIAGSGRDLSTLYQQLCNEYLSQSSYKLSSFAKYQISTFFQ